MGRGRLGLGEGQGEREGPAVPRVADSATVFFLVMFSLYAIIKLIKSERGHMELLCKGRSQIK